jgi:glyoxylase-like metal-dependent hydrolase (beta-lactamase superfamily II)
MTKPRRWWSRRLAIGAVVLVALVVVLFGAVWAIMTFTVLPLHDGRTLADGAVTTVVTGHVGPVTIGAYIFALSDGGVGLIDAGDDGGAGAIKAALGRAGKSEDEVRAIFLTHLHADHTTGARAFPRAQVYVLEADRRAVERMGVTVARGLRDGERVDAGGTQVEVFALPGHTPGSAAFLVHGVMFLGDSAAAAYDGSFQPNTILGTDPGQTERSVRALAERLRSRATEIRHLAFGHQGALEGLDAMLIWASVH